jgi:hypothetical protein
LGRTAKLVFCLILVSVMMGSEPVSAYEDIGYDPDDRPTTSSPPFGDPDVRSTVRRVERNPNGKVLVLVIRAYEDFSMYWFIDAFLDTRGGGRADHVVHLFNGDTGPVGCSISRENRDRRLHFRQHGKAVFCRVPIRFLEPSKRIRWRLVSETFYEDGEREIAPNGGGWYT